MCILRNHFTLIHAFFFDELCDSHPWWTAENLPGCRVTGLAVCSRRELAPMQGGGAFTVQAVRLCSLSGF